LNDLEVVWQDSSSGHFPNLVRRQAGTSLDPPWRETQIPIVELCIKPVRKPIVSRLKTEIPRPGQIIASLKALLIRDISQSRLLHDLKGFVFCSG
jgi:hypothetical protein